MPQPARPRTDAASHRAPSAQRVQIVSHLDEESGDRFYTGFPGEVGGGLFVESYDLKPLGTPIEVELHFPNGGITFARGRVEWIRELHARSPDIPPGMGISLGGLTPLAVRAVADHAAVREPLFWDGEAVNAIEAALPPRPTPATDDIAAETDVPLEPFEPDTRGEARFAAGLLRDVRTLLATGPTLLAASPAPVTELRVRVSRRPDDGQFHGGFTEDDGSCRAFVATFAALRVGAPLRLRIHGPTGVVAPADSEVLWLRRANPLLPSCAAPPGVGVRVRGVGPALWRELGGSAGGVLLCEESAGA